MPKNLQILVASDEEQNQIFKGLYIELYTDGVVVAGLSGLELE